VNAAAVVFALLALVVPRPPIVQKPIPYGPERKAQMAAYAERHYGIDTWRLVDPHVIVEHYTVTESFAPVYAEFSADVPDTELHELPGVCAQFVIDRDGTIYQLVPLDVMCRHTVGLNYTAIGIEHVGMSDRQILDDPRQMASSLALTLWLMEKFHISIGNVIGHNQSLTSPYHRELDPALRCQTHQDWLPADMAIYRKRLRALAAHYHAWLGAPYRPHPTGC
jgi:N-acetylmuramoyl-L-alanine amidase